MFILNAIESIFQFILDMGTPVMLPFMVLILGLFFRMKFSDSLKAGITIGAGFVGIFVLVDLLVEGYSPIREYYSSVGGNFTTVDVGWTGIAAMAWSTRFAVFIVPLGFLVNFILLRLKKTRTLNVDIWNYYSIILWASVAYYTFLGFGLSDMIATIIAILFGILGAVLVLIVGDKIAQKWQDYFDLPEGVTCTTFDTLFTHYPLSYAGAWIFDHIPGLNKLKIETDKLQSSKIGSWGSLPILTFVITAFLLAITKNDVPTILESSMTVTGAVVLMPKAVALLMEGLVPISNAARKWMAEKAHVDDALIGMDVSIGLGDPTGMTTTLFLLPISIGLAYVLPGVTYLPIALFGGMIWKGHAAAYMSEGNLLKSIFAGSFHVAACIIACSLMAPIATRLAFDAGVLQDTTQLITGGNIGDIPNIIVAGLGALLGAFR